MIKWFQISSKYSRYSSMSLYLRRISLIAWRNPFCFEIAPVFGEKLQPGHYYVSVISTVPHFPLCVKICELDDGFHKLLLVIPYKVPKF